MTATPDSPLLQGGDDLAFGELAFLRHHLLAGFFQKTGLYVSVSNFGSWLQMGLAPKWVNRLHKLLVALREVRVELFWSQSFSQPPPSSPREKSN